MLRLIIAEDEDIIRMGLVQTVDWQSMGVEIAGAAADGSEALRLVQELQPEVLLTDIRMPRLSGLELAEKVLELGLPTRVVFLTSYAEFAYAREALRLQAVDYLLKPIEEKELQRVMAKIANELSEQPPNANPQQDAAAKDMAQDLTDWLALLHEPGLNPHVRKALERIAADYGKHLSIEAVAEELSVSTSYLSRKLKEATGHTFGSLLARYRLQEALKLLAKGEYRVYEVAEQTGFGEYKSFCQTFKKYLHESPKRYMQQREAKAGQAMHGAEG